MSVRSVIVALTPATELLRAPLGTWVYRWALRAVGAQLARQEVSLVHISRCSPSFARPTKVPSVFDLTCEAMQSVHR